VTSPRRPTRHGTSLRFGRWWRRAGSVAGHGDAHFAPSSRRAVVVDQLGSGDESMPVADTQCGSKRVLSHSASAHVASTSTSASRSPTCPAWCTRRIGATLGRCPKWWRWSCIGGPSKRWWGSVIVQVDVSILGRRRRIRPARRAARPSGARVCGVTARCCSSTPRDRRIGWHFGMTGRLIVNGDAPIGRLVYGPAVPTTAGGIVWSSTCAVPVPARSIGCRWSTFQRSLGDSAG
jgi:hypothetical protein